MPVRINVTHVTSQRLFAAFLGTAIVSGWSCDPALRAAPFQRDASLPSVLAAPALSDAGGVVEDAKVVPDWKGNDVGLISAGPPDGASVAIVDDVEPGIPVVGDPSCPAAGCPTDTPATPPGLAQYFKIWHDRNDACWVGRADGLLLWRDSPPSRPLVVTGDGTGTVLLDANQLQSTATGGVRSSLLRIDGCSGDAWELGYIYAGTFTARRMLPFLPDDPAAYALAEPGIFGENAAQPFSSGTASLLARLQSAELNRHLAAGPNLRWLAGFRWLQWQEQFTLADRLDDGVNLIDDYYSSDCINNLFGGQLGVDARLLTLGAFRVDSVVKAGAYYNDASQTSVYSITDLVDPANSGTSTVTVLQSPASCSFVGEVGITGVLPIRSNWDLRFGYLALWLTGLAQPTQQLSGQSLPVGGDAVGTLTANGGALLQGVTLGLEGRW